MNDMVLHQSFFAPVSRDVLFALLTDYKAERVRIELLAEFVSGDMGKTMGYFLQANGREFKYSPVVASLFEREGAIAALNSEYWQRTLALTDVYSMMPQVRRDAWDESIRKLTTPEFTEDAVLPTIEQLLQSRPQFFCERVDNVFQALSGDHVTNSPMGFTRRMVIGYVFTEYDSVDHSRAGTINDLRCAIAKFVGRDEPRWNATSSDLNRCRTRRGQWQSFDGGALRIRVYPGARTAHLEVHPELAKRLNAILHHLHPHAIPSQHRTPSRKPPKSYSLIDRPLPFAVLDVLRDAKVASDHAVSFDYRHRDNKQASAEAVAALESIGGVASGMDRVEFDYDPRTIIDTLVMTGCIPDEKSHQFYQTPGFIVDQVLELADIDSSHECLEPSAGQGAIADRMPQRQTLCVEVAPLHQRILQAKGHQVVQGDFLVWALQATKRFSRICMNPPYGERRWQLHTDAAIRLLSPGGRLVAVLPASAHGKPLHAQWPTQWSAVISDAFAGTGVSVAIAVLDRPA